MRELTYRQALDEAMTEEMTRDPRVFVIGEDIGSHGGGAFRVTTGWLREVGDKRVRARQYQSQPSLGSRLEPLPRAWFQLPRSCMDFITCAMGQVCNQAAKIEFMSGQVKVPLVIRTPSGMEPTDGPTQPKP